MNRRNFLLTTGTFLAAATVPGIPVLAEPFPSYGRTILQINRGWRFKANKVSGAEAVDFDDSSFEPIVVPHTNVLLPWHSFDDKDYEFI